MTKLIKKLITIGLTVGLMVVVSADVALAQTLKITDVASVLKFLGYTPSFAGPIVVADLGDGKGPHIVKWDKTPQPTQIELETVAASQAYLDYVDPAAIQKRREIAAIDTAKASTSDQAATAALIKAAIVIAVKEVVPSYVAPDDAALSAKIQTALDEQKSGK